ncbi:hypothetical protein RDV84_20960 [Lysobacter yananisis]|uniref:GH26 domain-containing protein n=1 Tax=Lysobacter yananisis TaxID=1003114 RepID=A0ABY9P5S2_9GAMM|nr:hypothetical protein [Lysobacter yananisis]WMT02408.1 hypothetical protein RDV84_20960 [Lysobacter yananisis]
MNLRILCATLLSLAIALPLQAQAQARDFKLYNNTKYTDGDDRRLDIARSNLLGEPQLPELAKGVMPDEKRYKDAVRASLGNPGPLVLDFEHINLAKDPQLSATNLDKLQTLARWAREAAPGRQIGYYGFPGSIDKNDPARGKQLAESVDLFFPSLYTVDDDRDRWRRRLDNMVAAARKLDASKPVLPFVWPQYHDKTPRDGEFVASDYWKFQLDQLHRAADGAVIWSKRVSGGERDWVPVTRSFIQSAKPASSPSQPSRRAAPRP